MRFFPCEWYGINSTGPAAEPRELVAFHGANQVLAFENSTPWTILPTWRSQCDKSHGFFMFFFIWLVVYQLVNILLIMVNINGYYIWLLYMVIIWLIIIIIWLLVEPTPLKNDGVKVSWDDV